MDFFDVANARNVHFVCKQTVFFFVVIDVGLIVPIVNCLDLIVSIHFLPVEDENNVSATGLILEVVGVLGTRQTQEILGFTEF